MISEWNEVNSREDIDYLLGEYMGFHDSCLTELSYKSGAGVRNDNFMSFGKAEQRELHIIFNSQWKKEPLELCFIGVRKYCIAGWQENYFCDIYDCHLSVRSDLIVGKDEPIIVWADNIDFDPKSVTETDLLREPMDSYVFADKLKWRFI